MANETVKVYIEASERVSYTTVVEMPRAEFERMSKLLDSRDGAEMVMGTYIDPTRDWQDADNQEVDEFRLATDDEAA